MSPENRPSWVDYFMAVTHKIAERSSCTRRQVGALLVHNKRILASGYNGAPSGIRHCGCHGIECLRESMNVPSGERHELCRGLHAEQNAIIQAAVHGVSIEGCDLFCTTMPCFICTKMLINARIKEIYYCYSYGDKMSREMLREAGIKLTEVKA